MTQPPQTKTRRSPAAVRRKGARPRPVPPAPPENSATIDRAVIGATLMAVAFVTAVLFVQGDNLLTGPSNALEDLYAAAAGRSAAPPPAWEMTPPALRLPWLAWATLAYPAAALLWLTLGLWGAGLFVAFWRPPGVTGNLIFTAMSAPLFLGLLDGRSTWFLLPVAALAAREVRRSQDARAGWWLSLAAMRPELLLPLALLPIAQRRWRLLGGLASGWAAIAALSFLVGGTNWPIRIVEGLTSIAPESIWGLLPWAWALVLAGSVGATTLMAMARTSFPLALGAALAAGLLLSPNPTLTDAVLLLPGGLAAMALARTWALRAAAIALLAPALYLPFGPWAAHRLAALALLLGVFLVAAAREMLVRRGAEPSGDPLARPSQRSDRTTLGLI